MLNCYAESSLVIHCYIRKEQQMFVYILVETNLVDVEMQLVDGTSNVLGVYPNKEIAERIMNIHLESMCRHVMDERPALETVRSYKILERLVYDQ